MFYLFFSCWLFWIMNWRLWNMKSTLRSFSVIFFHQISVFKNFQFCVPPLTLCTPLVPDHPKKPRQLRMHGVQHGRHSPILSGKPENLRRRKRTMSSETKNAKILPQQQNYRRWRMYHAGNRKRALRNVSNEGATPKR